MSLTPRGSYCLNLSLPYTVTCSGSQEKKLFWNRVLSCVQFFLTQLSTLFQNNFLSSDPEEVTVYGEDKFSCSVQLRSCVEQKKIFWTQLSTLFQNKTGTTIVDCQVFLDISTILFDALTRQKKQTDCCRAI